ncbi:MAG TPA: choice-of-anchor L domain-containing protein [Taishania sp.]|nr:choice-of-anchor L domain-containing protein [Taishania sp.]
MKKVAISFVATLLLSLTSNAQLTVSPYNNGSGNNGAGGNLQQFVQNNLIGSGITISNVTFVGANRQMGSFNATNTVLGTVQNMNTGIILSTGMAETAIGPNDVPYACHAPYTAPYPSEPGGYIGNTTNDPDLSDLVGSNIKDKAILEFDFVPTGPTIEFKYIFGSEEYPEFVNDFNDAFGFFLSGPGITGPYSNNSINLAIVPGTSDPVTINTVNSTVNSSYYVYNGDNGSGNTVAPYKNQNQYIQYDGYTTTLTATANVQCGQTYHIKIAIADARDQAYDSGLFIKGGSLSSSTVTANDATISCSQSSVQLSVSTTVSNPQYSWSGPGIVSGANTATPTVNQPGTYTVTITSNGCVIEEDVEVTSDGSQTTPTFTNPGPICSGTSFALPTTSDNGITGTWDVAPNTSQTTTYTFTPSSGQCANTVTMEVVVNSSVTPTFTNPGPVCAGTSFTLPTSSNEGISGTWSPAIDNTQTTTYTFTPASGQCATTTTMQVVVSNEVTPTFTNPGPVCEGTSFTLPTTSNNGITGTWDMVPNTAQTTTYTFTPTSSGCATTTTMEVVVTTPTTPTFTNPGPVCAGTAFTLPTSSNEGISGTWSPAIDNSQTTTYTFTPASGQCAAATTIEVVVSNEVIPTFTNPGPVCEGTSFTLPTTSNNGIIGTWDLAPNTTQTTTYTFTPTTSGCATTTTLTVAINPTTTPDFSPVGPICVGEIFVLPDTSTNGIVGTWSPAIDNTQTTNYTFVPQSSGCVQNAAITVVVDPLLCAQDPIIHIPNVFTPNGDNTNETLDLLPQNIQELEYWIINRWGEVMYHSTSLTDFWNGKVKGKEAPEAVYFIKYKAKGSNDKLLEGHSYFHLQR